MACTQFNYVYRSGAPAGSPVPSYYTCSGLGEILTPVSGDIAFVLTSNVFYTFSGVTWTEIGGQNILDRVTILEFLVAAIIQKGFGGL